MEPIALRPHPNPELDREYGARQFIFSIRPGVGFSVLTVEHSLPEKHGLYCTAGTYEAIRINLPDPQSPWEFTLDGEPEGHIAVEDLIAFMKREGA